MIAWAIGTAEFVAGDVAAGIAHHEQAQKLLDARRDLRLWSRFQRSAASCLLGAGITDGVAELVRTASLGIEILGNNHDLAELRQVEAQLALHSGNPEEAVRIASEVLADPVLGAKELPAAVANWYWRKPWLPVAARKRPGRSTASRPRRWKSRVGWRPQLRPGDAVSGSGSKKAFDKNLTALVKSDRIGLSRRPLARRMSTPHEPVSKWCGNPSRSLGHRFVACTGN